jgi:hypothetical protein
MILIDSQIDEDINSLLYHKKYNKLIPTIKTMVSKTTLALLFTVCLTASVAATNIVQETEAEELIETNYILASLRGFLQGYERGLYNNSTLNVSAKCLASDSTSNAILMWDDYKNDNVADAFDFLVAAYNFQYSLNEFCGIQDVTYDTINFLAASDISIDTFFSSFMKKFFTITGALNNIGSIFYTTTLPPTSNSAAYFTIYQTIGLNLGNVVNTVLGFKVVAV